MEGEVGQAGEEAEEGIVIVIAIVGMLGVLEAAVVAVEGPEEAEEVEITAPREEPEGGLEVAGKLGLAVAVRTTLLLLSPYHVAIIWRARVRHAVPYVIARICRCSARRLGGS